MSERIHGKREIARQAFLYGCGDGKPVVTPAALAKLSGCHIATIQNHLPAWIKEREEMLVASDSTGLSLRLSPDVLHQHKEDVAFLRQRLDALQAELTALPVLEAALRKAASNLSPGNEEIALEIIEKWLAISGSKSALTSQIMAVQRQWAKMQGVDAVLNISEAREKAIATGQAKLEIKRESARLDSTPPSSAGSQAGAGIFRRSNSAPAVDVDPVPEGDDDGLC